jgi:hypothetical protein
VTEWELRQVPPHCVKAYLVNTSSLCCQQEPAAADLCSTLHRQTNRVHVHTADTKRQDEYPRNPHLAYTHRRVHVYQHIHFRRILEPQVEATSYLSAMLDQEWHMSQHQASKLVHSYISKSLAMACSKT